MEEKEMGRKRTPEEEARRKLIRELLSNANVTGMEDIQRLFKETIAEFLEGSLDAELEETLGYGRYDHAARTESGTTNSRNGHSRKTMKTSAGKIGVNLEGRKSVLGMWVGENESAKFWASVLNNLKNRKVEDILIVCTDNLTGFSEAIAAVFPKTDIQNCIIHQLRNSSKYVSYKVIKALMTDLKRVYQAVDEQSALAALDDFAEIRDKKYPKISKSWRENWANLSTYFKFPEELRRLIYTTNAIEGFNRQLRKVTKSKAVFPTDDSLFKMLYLAMLDITKKWTGRRQDWAQIYPQLALYYSGRIPE